jgi:hypothetical protein
MNTDSTSASEGFRRVGSYAIFAFVYILPQENSACHEMFMEIRKKYLNSLAGCVPLIKTLYTCIGRTMCGDKC